MNKITIKGKTFYRINNELDIWSDAANEMSNIEATNYVIRHRPTPERDAIVSKIAAAAAKYGLNTRDSKNIKARFSFGTDVFVYVYTAKKCPPYHCSKKVTLQINRFKKGVIYLNELFLYDEGKVMDAFGNMKTKKYNGDSIVFSVNDIDEAIKCCATLLK